MRDDVTEAERLLTAAEFLTVREPEHRELVRGRVVELPRPGPRHGSIVVRLAVRIGGHVEAHDLGCVMADSGYVLARGPDTVRGPDVALLQAIFLLFSIGVVLANLVADLLYAVIDPRVRY